MNDILGPNNSLFDYVLVLGVYAALFIALRYGNPTVELNFVRTYWLLCFGWAVSVFAGNYVFFKLGIMSFLPWLNNFIHCFVWIGLCLSFLYAGSHRKPWWEQFLLFAVFSFIVKRAEFGILGTWEMDHFFFIRGNLAYIIGWSLMDGFYPAISSIGLRLISKYVRGVITA